MTRKIKIRTRRSNKVYNVYIQRKTKEVYLCVCGKEIRYQDKMMSDGVYKVCVACARKKLIERIAHLKKLVKGN